MVAHVAGDGLLHVDDIVMADLVELVGGDPGLDVLADHGQHFGGQLARDLGLGDLCRGVDNDAGLHECAPVARGVSCSATFKSRPPACSARTSRRQIWL